MVKSFPPPPIPVISRPSNDTLRTFWYRNRPGLLYPYSTVPLNKRFFFEAIMSLKGPKRLQLHLHRWFHLPIVSFIVFPLQQLPM